MDNDGAMMRPIRDDQRQCPTTRREKGMRRRLRCRVGLHLIDWSGGGREQKGSCVYCGDEFISYMHESWNVSAEERAAAKYQAKIDRAKARAARDA